MVKALSLILTLAGMVGLVLGVLGIFGRDYAPVHPWALAILGLIFFSSGIGLLKKAN